MRMPITGGLVHTWFLRYQAVYAWNEDKKIVKQRELLPLNAGNEHVCMPFARREIEAPEGGFFEEANRALADGLAEKLRALEENNVVEA